MTTYELLTLVHVAAAIVWVGGATLVTTLMLLLLRRDDEDALRFLGATGLLHARLFIPAAVVTILAGVALAWLGGWWPAAWLVLASGLVAAAFVAGAAVLGPLGERAAALWRAGDGPAAAALARRLVRLVRLDLGAQWAVVSLMVLKPGWTDPALLVPAGLILLGAALALLPAPRSDRRRHAAWEVPS